MPRLVHNKKLIHQPNRHSTLGARAAHDCPFAGALLEEIQINKLTANLFSIPGPFFGDTAMGHGDIAEHLHIHGKNRSPPATSSSHLAIEIQASTFRGRRQRWRDATRSFWRSSKSKTTSAFYATLSGRLAFLARRDGQAIPGTCVLFIACRQRDKVDSRLPFPTLGVRDAMDDPSLPPLGYTTGLGILCPRTICPSPRSGCLRRPASHQN